MTKNRAGVWALPGSNVRFGLLADILTSPRHVRFTPITDVGQRIQVCIWLAGLTVPRARPAGQGEIATRLLSACDATDGRRARHPRRHNSKAAFAKASASARRSDSHRQRTRSDLAGYPKKYSAPCCVELTPHVRPTQRNARLVAFPPPHRAARRSECR